MSKIIYFTSWYREAHPERLAELQTCVQNCIDSPDLDEVHLLCEGGAVFVPLQNGNEHKLRQEMVADRPTYNMFFEYMNKVSAPGSVVILGNTDIYPAENMRPLFEQIKGNECWALSRWDYKENGEIVHHARRDSMDNWLFISPIREGIKGNFMLGKGGCDNSIALWIQEAGYEVSNPSCDVRFIHLHLTGVHNYTPGIDSIPPPYLLVEPTRLGVIQPNKYHIPWQPTVDRPLTPHTTR